MELMAVPFKWRRCYPLERPFIIDVPFNGRQSQRLEVHRSAVALVPWVKQTFSASHAAETTSISVSRIRMASRYNAVCARRWALLRKKH